MYFQQGLALMAETLRNDALPACALRALSRRQYRARLGRGCLQWLMMGNFAIETGGNDNIRPHLVENFGAVAAAISYCLKAAVTAGELRAGLDCDDIAAFLVSALQGSNLLAKVEAQCRTAETASNASRSAACCVESALFRRE